MKFKIIIISSIIILFLVFSCNNNEFSNESDYPFVTSEFSNEFDYPFVINEKEINKKCFDTYKELIIPTDIESVDLLGLYKLDVKLDTIIYKSDTYANAFYIGVKYRFNKKVSHHIWALLFESGAIYSCSFVNSDSILLINNGHVWFTNFHPSKRECLNLDENIKITELRDNQIGYWTAYQSSTFFGDWIKGDFHNKTDETWNFTRGITFEDFGDFTSIAHHDTLLSGKFQISDDSLIFHTANKKVYQIKTYTKNSIVLFDNENDNEILLTRK